MKNKQLQLAEKANRRLKALGYSIFNYGLKSNKLTLKAVQLGNRCKETLYVVVMPDELEICGCDVIPDCVKHIHLFQGAVDFVDYCWFESNLPDESKYTIGVREALQQQMLMLDGIEVISTNSEEDFERLCNAPHITSACEIQLLNEAGEVVSNYKSEHQTVLQQTIQLSFTMIFQKWIEAMSKVWSGGNSGDYAEVIKSLVSMRLKE